MSGNLRVLDLFAGCGGLSRGFTRAGFVVNLANEFWHPAAETYRLNHPHAKMIEGDVTDPDIKKQIINAAKGKIDVIIGGPPCQAFSLAGQRDAADPRGKLFYDYIDIVKAVHPKMFVLENVKGILSMKHDRDSLSEQEQNKVDEMRKVAKRLSLQIKQNNVNADTLARRKRKLIELRNEIMFYQEPVTNLIVRRFNEIGYTIKHRTLNAANYGVPQKRERVIFIGTRLTKDISFPEPTHSGNGQLDLVGKKGKKWVTVKKAIDDLKDKPENQKFHHILPNHSSEFIKKIKNTPIGSSVFESYGDAFLKTPPDEPSRTVKENHNGVFVHYKKDRVMTARELARLQDFDDDFTFFGTKSSVLIQIGNAVPVGLGEAVANSIKESLNKSKISQTVLINVT